MSDRYTSSQYVSDDRSRHEKKIERELEEIDVNLSRTNVLLQQILDKMSEEKWYENKDFLSAMKISIAVWFLILVFKFFV
jgi:hypothetical protein